jgi:biopolymer transport protein ExbD
MRKKRVLVAEEEENEINLTPMLDVVFIMLM